MSQFNLTKTRIHGGFWEGIVECADPATGQEPLISVTLEGDRIRNVSLKADSAQSGCWHLRIAIPPERITDGVQTFLIRDDTADVTLDSFSILAGDPLASDLRAEIDLLRAELDTLKRAFRAHCLEA